MKVLFIGPLPEPTTGQSLACQVFYDYLVESNDVDVININKSTFKQGVESLNRIFEIGKILWQVWKKKSDKDIIYFTITESYAGNLKDILIYLICYTSLAKMVIHLHGGAGMREIMLGKNRLLSKLNTFFLNRMGAIIILGARHLDIYSGVNDKSKIHVVPNFAQDYLFVTEEVITDKFKKSDPLRVLFLSNLLPGKGHDELVQAYISLDDKHRATMVIDFAGGFESEEHRLSFLHMIDRIPQIQYQGTVQGDRKKTLFADAHVFCLPTYYPYEGQPISILEAYASGCIVITTDHSGIGDVFTNEVNGYEVHKKSVDSLRATLEKLIVSKEDLQNIAKNNLTTAQEKFRTANFNSNLMTVINKVVSKKNGIAKCYEVAQERVTTK